MIKQVILFVSHFLKGVVDVDLICSDLKLTSG